MPTFTAIDFETLPGDHGPEPAEFALVVFNTEGEILHFFEAALPVNKLYASSPACRDSLVSAWAELKPWLQDSILVGHNIGYDTALLYKCFPALQVERCIDTLDVARKAYPKTFDDYSLTALLENFDLLEQVGAMKLNDHYEPHRALYDSVACALLTLQLLNQPKGREMILPPIQGTLF